MTTALTPAAGFGLASAPNRQLVAITLFTALAALPLILAYGLDPRAFQGDSIWLKPLKFHLSLAVYTGTLVLFAMLLPQAALTGRGWRLYLGLVILCILAELLWIGGAAALGTASHFNLAIPGLYTAMGVAAVTLTSLSLALGVLIWRQRPDPLGRGIAVGLVLTFALTLVTAGTMSAAGGHLVGTPLTGARLPVFGWSAEVGDLRLAHFLATHAMHAVPLAGLTGRPGAVWAAALGWTALTLWCFARALSGLPPI